MANTQSAFNDLTAIFNKLNDSIKELDKSFEKSTATSKKFQFTNVETTKRFKDYFKELEKIQKLNEKKLITDAKAEAQVKKLNKQFKDAGLSTAEYNERIKELNAAMQKTPENIEQIQKEIEALNNEYEKSTGKMSKVKKAFDEISSHASGTISTFAKLGAVLGAGLSLSLEELADKSAKFGKTLYDIQQTAAATGQSSDKLRKSVDNLSTATGLSAQHAAEYVLAFQEGIKTTQLTTDQIEALGKTMRTAGVSFEGMQKQQQAMINIQNANSESTKFLMDNFKNTDAIDGFIGKLQDLNGISDADALEFKKLANVMKDPTAFNDDPQVQMARAMSDLKESAMDLELAVAKALTPALKWLAGAITDVMKYLKENPWATWAGIAIAAVGTIIGIIGSLAGSIMSIIQAVEAIGAAFTALTGVAVPALGGMVAGAAAVVLPLVVIAASVAEIIHAYNEWVSASKDVAQATEEIKKTQDALNAARMKLKPNEISGFDQEQKEIEMLKKKHAELTKIKETKTEGGILATRTVKTIDMDSDYQARAAEIAKKQAALDAKRQSKLSENLKGGKSGAGTGVLEANSAAMKDQAASAATLVDKSKQTADADKARGQNNQVLRAAYQSQVTQLEAVNKLQSAILENEGARYEYLLKYENDIGGAVKSNEAMVTALKKQLAAQNDLLKAASARVERNPDDPGAAADQAKAQSEIFKIQEQINVKLQERTHIYDEQKSAIDANINLAESELALSKQLYLGLAPSLEAQQKAVDLYNEKIMLVEKEISAAKRLVAEQPKNLQAQKNLRDLQTEKNQLQSKELEITKNLREGYLDAMGAFTNVEGAFSKIIARKDTAFGEAMRQFKVEGGLRTGQIGAGSDVALARRDAKSGQLDIASSDTVKKVTEGYVKGQPGADELVGGIGAIQKARFEKDAGMEDVSAASAAGGGSNVGGISAARRAATGSAGQPATGGGAMAPAASTDAVGAVDRLNNDMAKRVTEGINNSKLAATATATGGGGGGGGPTPAAGAGALAPAAPAPGAMAPAAPAQGGGGGGGGAAANDVDDTPRGKYQKMADNRRKEMAEQQKSFDKYMRENRAGGRDLTTGGGGGGLLATKGAGGVGGPGSTAANDKVRQRMEGISGLNPDDKKKYEGALKDMQHYRQNMMSDKDNMSKGKATQKDFDYDKAQYEKAKQTVDSLNKIAKHAETTSKATQETAKIADKGDKAVQQAKTEGGGSLNALNAASIGMGPMNGASMFGMSGGSGPLGLDLGNTPAFQSWTAAPDAQPGNPASAIGAAGWGAPMARGGKIPGVGDSDNVPALLMPGERVIPKAMERKYGDLFDAMNKNKFALGGVVGPSPSMARGSGGRGGAPNISLNVRGESVNSIMKSVHGQLSSQLNRMMAPNGTTGRFFELSHS